MAFKGKLKRNLDSVSDIEKHPSPLPKGKADVVYLMVWDLGLGFWLSIGLGLV